MFFVCIIVNRFAYIADEVQCNRLFAWVTVPMQRDGSIKPLLQIDWESVQHVHIRGQEWQGLKSYGSGSATRIAVKLQWHESYQGCYKSMLQIGAAHKNGCFITGRWLHVGFQMNQMNMTDRTYVFMLRISDPLQSNQWGISGPNHHWWWNFVASCYTEDKDRLHGMETHWFSSKKKSSKELI